MPAPCSTSRVAVISTRENTSSYLVRLLARAEITAGQVLVSDEDPRSAITDLLDWLKPAVCICDVVAPYAETWRMFQELHGMFPTTRFIMATPSKARLEQEVGQTDAVEYAGFATMSGDDLIATVRRALGDRVGC